MANDVPGSPEMDEFGFHDSDSLNMWIDNMELELDGLKVPPPLEMIKFEEHMKRAWYKDRLVPWSSGILPFRTYMVYLKKFFGDNAALLPNLHDAAEQCVKAEKKHIKSGNAHPKLSLRIKKKAKRIKKQEEQMSKSAASVVVAGLVCIAAEAELMSKLSATDTASYKACNKVRLCALRLMAYEGPESDAMAAAMLGMSVEAEKLPGLLRADDIKSIEGVNFCLYIRRNTQAFLRILQERFVSKTAVNSDWRFLDSPKWWILLGNEADTSKNSKNCEKDNQENENDMEITGSEEEEEKTVIMDIDEKGLKRKKRKP